MKKQLAFIMARQGLFHSFEESEEDLAEILYGSNLNDNFLALARDLGTNSYQMINHSHKLEYIIVSMQL